jgi:hypothetical protein
MSRPSGYIWTCFSCGKKSAWGGEWADFFNCAVVCSGKCADAIFAKGAPELPMGRYQKAVRDFSEWLKQKRRNK